jgi:hypothetical protein
VLAILLRLWVVVTIAWWAYHLYLYRDKLSTFKTRDWGQAFEYGVNNIFCDFPALGLCKDVSVSMFKRTEVNETFGLIVTFVGWPVLFLVMCPIVAWIIRAPRNSQSKRSK